MNVNTRGRLNRSQIPQLHRDARIEPSGAFASSLALCRERVSDGGIVAIIGKRGTGKTQLAAELMREACEVECAEPQEPAYRTAYMLFCEIRTAMKNAGEMELVGKFAKARLLVIDEAHERGETAWEDRTMTAIIDARYGAKLPTVLIANTDAANLVSSLRESIASRITEGGAVIVCDWESFRGRASK